MVRFLIKTPITEDLFRPPHQLQEQLFVQFALPFKELLEQLEVDSCGWKELLLGERALVRQRYCVHLSVLGWVFKLHHSDLTIFIHTNSSCFNHTHQPSQPHSSTSPQISIKAVGYHYAFLL